MKGVARAYEVLVSNYNLRFIGDHPCVSKRLADQKKNRHWLEGGLLSHPIF